jgi:hypothetical protein
MSFGIGNPLPLKGFDMETINSVLDDRLLPLLNRMCHGSDYMAARAIEAMREGKWINVMLCVNKPYRLDAIIVFERFMDDAGYWQCVNDAWTSMEGCGSGSNSRCFARLFSSKRPGRENLMSELERATLEALPDTISVYRGFVGRRGRGLSWSRSRKVAEWFARRFACLGGQPTLIEGVAHKDKVLAYLNDRQEQEIVILPEHVQKQRRTSLARRESFAFPIERRCV